MYPSEEERLQKNEDDDGYSDVHVQPAPVNKDSKDEDNKDQDDQTSLGSCKEDYPLEERSQQENIVDDKHNDVHIQPASENHHYSENEYNEDQDDQKSLEPPKDNLRC